MSDTDRATFGFGMVASAGLPALLFVANRQELAKMSLSILGLAGVALVYHYHIRSEQPEGERHE